MSFLNEPNIELDPDIARLQAQASGALEQIAVLPLPVAAFVAALNGLTGPISLAGGTSGGLTISITPGVGTITISISGNGTMATKNVAAAVADLNQTIAGPTIAEVQAISDKVDELLGVLRTAVHIAT